MNKSINILIVTIFSLGANVPVFAQWDLGGMSAGQGQGNQGKGMGNQLLGPGGVPMQPYTEHSAVPFNQSQTIYDQRGSLVNPNARIPNVSTPYANPYQGGGGTLPSSSMLPLSRGQTTLPKNLSGVRFSPSTGALPPTTLDSFVHNAGGAASRIYGDEGTGFFGPPPDNGFPESSTINAGIVGSNNKTLTTGHRSKMPSASGNGATWSGAH